MKKYSVKVDGVVYEVEIEEVLGTSPQVKRPQVSNPRPAPTPQRNRDVEESPKSPPNLDGAVVSAPMPGKILSLKCSEGDQVKKGDVLLILEAMKMENEVSAIEDGKVLSINVSEGDMVEGGASLVTIG